MEKRNLTKTEVEVLRGITEGLTHKELANKFHRSPHTIRTHLKNIYEKLDAHSKIEAMIKAKEIGES